MYVETDKTVYAYDDFIYVTATISSLTGEVFTFTMPTSRRGVHQELTVIIQNEDGDQLTDADMYIENYPADGGTFTLSPDERYVQTMRFTTNFIRNQVGAIVHLQHEPAAGIYHGEVTAHFTYQGKEESLTVPFEITIEEPKE